MCAKGVRTVGGSIWSEYKMVAKVSDSQTWVAFCDGDVAKRTQWRVRRWLQRCGKVDVGELRPGNQPFITYVICKGSQGHRGGRDRV